MNLFYSGFVYSLARVDLFFLKSYKLLLPVTFIALATFIFARNQLDISRIAHRLHNQGASSPPQKAQSKSASKQPPRYAVSRNKTPSAKNAISKSPTMPAPSPQAVYKEIDLGDGVVFKGYFVDDLREGRGITVYKDGNQEECFYKTGKRNGLCLTKTPKALIVKRYIGGYSPFQARKLTGFTKGIYRNFSDSGMAEVDFTLVDGERFLGEFNFNTMEGAGSILDASGKMVYAGEVNSRLQRHGTGKIYQLDGASRTALFRKGIQIPQVGEEKPAILPRKSNAVSTSDASAENPARSSMASSGIRQDKALSGRDKPASLLRDSEETSYQGQVGHGKMHSQDIQSRPDNRLAGKERSNGQVANRLQKIHIGWTGQYVGNVVDGKPEGRGICRWLDGSYYKGYWKNGVPHGAGEYFDGYFNVKGEFVNGKIGGIQVILQH